MMVLHPHILIVCLGEKALVMEEGWDGKPEGSKFNRVKSKDPWVHYPFQNCMSFPFTKLLKKDVDTVSNDLWPSALDIKPVNAKGNPPRIFIERTDAEAEAPVFGHLIWKDPDAGKDWGQEEKGVTEDEMVGWHHQLNGHEFEPWWRTGKPGALQSVGSQRVGQDLVTEQQPYFNCTLTTTVISLQESNFILPSYTCKLKLN